MKTFDDRADFKTERSRLVRGLCPACGRPLRVREVEKDTSAVCSCGFTKPVARGTKFWNTLTRGASCS